MAMEEIRGRGEEPRDAVHRAPAPGGAPDEAPGGGPGAALLVEDDPGVLRALQGAVESAGWSAEAARDGAEALESLARSRPDVILLDLEMPGMDGWQLLESLGREAVFAGIPVVVVSAFAAPAGVRALRKPVALEALVEVLDEHAPRRGGGGRPPEDEGGPAEPRTA